MSALHIPMYHVSLRHPKLGWQTVAVAYTEDEGRRQVNEWHQFSHGLCDIKLAHTEGDNTWRIVYQWAAR